MPYLSPHERALRRVRQLKYTLAFATGLLFFTLLDAPLVPIFRITDPAADTARALAEAFEPAAARGPLAGRDDTDLSRKVQRSWVESEDWWQALRAYGTMTTWVAVGVLLSLAARRSALPERREHAWHLGLGLVFAAGLGGAAAELLKYTLRRHRPGPGGEYSFGWWTDALGVDFSYGLASSHTAVAFGAAWFLGRLWPGLRWAALLLALGCGVTRLLTGAHYLTDVYVGALLGVGTAEAVWRSGVGLGTLAPWRVRSGVTP